MIRRFFRRKIGLVIFVILLILTLWKCSLIPPNNTNIPSITNENAPNFHSNTSDVNSIVQNEEGLENDLNSPIWFSFKVDNKEINIPYFEGEPYVIVNNNKSFFTNSEKTTNDVFENYNELDSLGRCGVAYANICEQLMPTEDRGAIGHIKPSGWHTVKYNDLIEGNYLYNRCHLIAFCLAGENDNEKNLITGTRYLNTIGMLPFETQVLNYVRNNNLHVLYRVTPIFVEDELVARGVLIEAYSIEDNGKLEFNIFAYNKQPGIYIDYNDGSSFEIDVDNAEIVNEEAEVTYILNTKTKKIQTCDCEYVNDIAIYNKQSTSKSLEELINEGYTKCKKCLSEK